MRSTSSRLSSIHLLGVALNTDIASVTQRMLEDPSAAGYQVDDESCRCITVELLDDSPSTRILRMLVGSWLELLASSTKGKKTILALLPSRPKRAAKEWKEEWLRVVTDVP
ncbi:hypothetical protein OE88DRAFT_1659191 [Heliocybe sulcata]|uniref:Uncharacterized protein n=1 Tax=Heliocybe sulcata TaxID=5364 RepID=A0A5C3N4D9_9AGAM|nr:hypothetical protein OE88DRAFT_1659191 [Heliocybe sulcata]